MVRVPDRTPPAAKEVSPKGDSAPTLDEARRRQEVASNHLSASATVAVAAADVMVGEVAAGAACVAVHVFVAAAVAIEGRLEHGVCRRRGRGVVSRGEEGHT